MVGAYLQAADTLHQALLHGAADTHDLTGGLHLGGKLVGSLGELIEGEAGKLRYHIVYRGLIERIGVSDADLVQGHSQGHLCGDLCDGIGRCLGCQGRGTGDSGVDLDQEVLGGVGVQRKLYVAAALDLQGPQDL